MCVEWVIILVNPLPLDLTVVVMVTATMQILE